MGHALQISDTHRCPKCGTLGVAATRDGSGRYVGDFTNHNRLGKPVGQCRRCLSATARRWNLAHPDRALAAQKRYRQLEKERRRELRSGGLLD